MRSAGPDGGNEGAIQPFCAFFYARALPIIDVAFTSSKKRIPIDLLSRTGEGRSIVMKTYDSKGKTHRRNHAIATVCTLHSHSIVPGGLLVMS